MQIFPDSLKKNVYTQAEKLQPCAIQ